MEEIRGKIEEAVRIRDYDGAFDAIMSYCLTASRVPDDIDFANLSWIEALGLYIEALVLNLPQKKFPILRKGSNQDRPIWEYEGRTWYFWANKFATNYGWELEYIGNLDVDDAIALFQELETDVQLQKEWEWSKTELAYPYNSSTKTSSFQPLPRPEWMRPVPQPPKKIRIRKDMLPAGVIIDFNASNRPT